jgi:membrane associated rhomboid family serine protease
MLNRIKFSVKVTLQVLLVSLGAFFVFAIFLAIFGENAQRIVFLNPLINGFMHSGFEHILYNLLLIFLFLLADINRPYDINKIFWVTFLLSCTYLPIALLNITEPAIGVSGTCYFLMSRFFFTREKYKAFNYIIFGILIVAEISTIANNDGIAHGVHLIGAVIGLISLNPDKYRILPNRVKRVIA